MGRTITVIPGDGVGPEIVEATISVLDSLDLSFEYETIELNAQIMQDSPSEIPSNVLASITKNKVAIKGPISTPVGEGYTSPNVLLRQQLELFASIRPAKTIWSGAPVSKPLDVIVVRENTEDVYVARERKEGDTAIAEKVITRKASERVARCAFELATLQRRKTVTALHKADILKLTDGLFLESCRVVAKDFPEIDYNEAIIDSACMQLILDPARFDVIVTENMYGDIVSDITSGLIGGLGLAGSANMGSELAVYEAVHGSAPDIAGKDIANPTGLLMACVMMLRNIDEDSASQRLAMALEKTIVEGKILTQDMNGEATTTEFSQAIIANL